MNSKNKNKNTSKSVRAKNISNVKKKKALTKKKRSKIAKKRVNIFYVILTVIFLGVLVAIRAINFTSTDKEISIEENRDLQQKPLFSVSQYFDGTYQKDETKYVADQFAGRKTWVKTKSKFDILKGTEKLNGVVLAKDGYLMEPFEKNTEESTNTKADAINKFIKSNPKLKISLLLAPNKVEIYNNKLPKFTPTDDEDSYIRDFSKKLVGDIKVVNVIDAFKKDRDQGLYFKTDHHWNTNGAYLAYRVYCEQNGFKPVSKNNYNIVPATNDFYGSLYSKIGGVKGDPETINLYLPLSESAILARYFDGKKSASIYNSEKLKEKDKYEVFTGGNHSQIRVRTKTKTDKRLLLIKDSYANCMLEFLTNNFSEIQVLDLRYFTGSVKEVIKNYEITDVLILQNVNTFNEDTSILNIND